VEYSFREECDVKHRTEEEIAALILQSIASTNNRATQTIILHKAYLAFAQLKRFLECLLEKGLIQYEKEQRIYIITEKGMHFLQVCNQLNQLQISNIFNSTNQYDENVYEFMQATKYGNEESRYLTTSTTMATATANESKQTMTRTTGWECQKCQRLFANLKELKLHKVEYHSY
jgi:predicted transcriptional regulator